MQTDDKDIVQALLDRNSRTTREFLYRTCYPLFKSIYDNYHTDCCSVLEFINEIYIHILTPSPDSGLCPLQKFNFQSTLFTWLKTVALFYCYKRYKRTSRLNLSPIVQKFDEDGVRNDILPDSISSEATSMMSYDIEKALLLMPNKRYSQLIRYRYLQQYSNEETAQLMGMNMNTYYNKHKLAKDQYIKTLKSIS